MPFVPTADAVAISIVGSLFGQEIINTLYFTKSGVGGFTLADLLEISNLVGDDWAGNMLPNLSSDYVMARVVATDVSVENGLQVVNTEHAGAAGTHIGSAAPGNVAFCVSLRTGHTGRSFRGRNYVAGIDSTGITGNTIGAAQAQAFVDVYAGLANDAGALGWIMSVVSKFADGVPRTAGLATPITSVLYVDTVLDSQRRRLTGRGV